MCEVQEQPAVSNEAEIWREPPMNNGPSAARIFTVPGGIGISVNGMCAVRPVRIWHSYAETNADLVGALSELLDAFEIATDNFQEIEFRGVMFPPYRVSEFIRAAIAKAEGQMSEANGSPTPQQNITENGEGSLCK